MARMTASAAYFFPSAVLTPVTLPSSVRISAASAPSSQRTPAFRSPRSRAAITSELWSLTGNTRLPRSVFSGQPLSSTRFMMSRFVNSLKALYRKRGFDMTFAMTVCMSAAFVRLQRPFPVMNSFFPSFSFFSSSVTRAPASAAACAASMPAAPPPITMTFFIIFGAWILVTSVMRGNAPYPFLRTYIRISALLCYNYLKEAAN